MEIKCSNCGAVCAPQENRSPLKYCPKCGEVLVLVGEDEVEQVEYKPPVINDKNAMPQNAAWFGIAVLCLVELYGKVMVLCIGPAVSSIAREFDIESSRMGLIWGVSHTVYGIFLLPGGYLADRVKRTTVVAIFSILLAISTILIGFCKSFEQLFALRVFGGICDAMILSAFITLLFDYAPRKYLNRIYALYIIMPMIGGGIAYIVSALIIKNYGWNSVFWILGSIGLFFAGLLLFIQEPGRGGVEDRSHSRISAVESGYKMSKIFRNPAILWLFLFTLIYSTCFSEVFSGITKVAERYHGIETMDMATKYMPFGMLLVLISYVVSAHYTDTRKEKIPFISHYIILGGMILGSLFVLIFANATNTFLLCVGLYPFLFFMQLVMVPMMVLLLTSVRPERRGLLYGVLLFTEIIITKPMMPFITGSISDAYNLRAALSTIIIIFIPVAAACMIAAIRTEKKAMQSNGVPL